MWTQPPRPSRRPAERSCGPPMTTRTSVVPWSMTTRATGSSSTARSLDSPRFEASLSGQAGEPDQRCRRRTGDDDDEEVRAPPEQDRRDDEGRHARVQDQPATIAGEGLHRDEPGEQRDGKQRRDAGGALAVDEARRDEIADDLRDVAQRAGDEDGDG